MPYYPLISCATGTAHIFSDSDMFSICLNVHISTTREFNSGETAIPCKKCVETRKEGE